MELSRTVASLAVVLGVILAAGHAFGDAVVPEAAKATGQERTDVAVEEQQERSSTEFKAP